jgi:hypothetical protein
LWVFKKNGIKEPASSKYLNYQNRRTDWFQVFQKFRIKEPASFRYLKKSQKQRTGQFWVVQNLQRTNGFRERTDILSQFLRFFDY